MVKSLRSLASEEADDGALLINLLADEIAIKDWTIRDAVLQGVELAKVDEEYARALDSFDSAVFRNRFPEFFS